MSDPKPIHQSKTVWFNVLSLGVIVPVIVEILQSQELRDWIAVTVSEERQTLVMAAIPLAILILSNIGNLALRAVTTTGVQMPWQTEQNEPEPPHIDATDL